MGEPSRSSSSSTGSNPPPPASLVKPSEKKKKKTNAFRIFRSIFRSFPILTPVCGFPSLPGGILPSGFNFSTGSRVTGTLFGYRKGRVSLSIQENPKTLPTLVMELAMQTHALQKDMNLGMVRIVMECEKRKPEEENSALGNLLEEPVWTMYYKGKKTGYGLTREPTAEDLHFMELLKAISTGAGVLPWNSKAVGEGDEADGEMVYMRAHFNRVVGSKDSETLHMLSPADGNNNGPAEFSIFFVRV